MAKSERKVNTLPKPVKTKKVKKKKVKSERQKLIIACDNLWSDCIIARDKTCRYSNSEDRLSAHHIRGKSHYSTRWDLENGLCLSWTKIHFLQKNNPEFFQDKIIEIIGDEKYQQLKTKSLVRVDYSIADLRDIKESLEKKLDDIKRGLDYSNVPF
ncbi:MAG: hypothetical protein WC332_00200 [Clostridia bacterium]|jgi:hypothetical protein